jgi:hypothetical protein
MMERVAVAATLFLHRLQMKEGYQAVGRRS